jgi:hypothetical protein
MLLHNLAVLNLCEIQDYNERLADQREQGVEDNVTLSNRQDSPELFRRLDEQENEQLRHQKEEAILSEQIAL